MDETHTTHPEGRGSELAVADDRPQRPEGRRLEVALAAQRAILERGLEATTLRQISAEAGFTTGVIMHHFPDKEAVIAACFELVSADWIADVERQLEQATTSTERLVALARLAVPSDPSVQYEWRLWAEMWTYAGRTPAFAGVLTAVDAMWERRIARVLDDAHVDGTLRADLHPEIEASIVCRLVDGLGLRAWLTGDWATARRSLAAHLGSLGLAPETQLVCADMNDHHLPEDEA